MFDIMIICSMFTGDKVSVPLSVELSPDGKPGQDAARELVKSTTPGAAKADTGKLLVTTYIVTCVFTTASSVSMVDCDKDTQWLVGTW